MGQILTDTFDTIAAPATPSQTSALAIMRLSGKDAVKIADSIWQGASLEKVKSHTAHLGIILDRQRKPLDQAVAIVYRAPHSFTGEDSVEFTIHGSIYIRRELLDTLVQAGARIALPGEFTRRALQNGRFDLAQAEAVADIIAAQSRAAHRIAVQQLGGKLSDRIKELRKQLTEIATLLELELDFSEEDVEFASRTHLRQLAQSINKRISHLLESFRAGNALKNGIDVAIIGPTNAGKSSLLNAILGYDRAIVSNIHGTTRDTIQESINISDYQFNFIDTAGLRSTSDPIEQIGINRTRQTLQNTRIILFVVDATTPFPLQELQQVHRELQENTDVPQILVVFNKTDLLQSTPDATSSITNISTLFPNLSHIMLSAATKCGLDTLIKQLTDYAANLSTNDADILITNQRHAQALADALESSERLNTELSISLPPDLVAQTLRETIHHLATITGDIPSSTILSAIFSRFCIGK